MPTDVDADLPEQRILEQSVRLPAGGAVTGWAACRLLGAAFFDGLERDGHTERPVPLALGPTGRIRGDGRVALSYHALPAGEIVRRHGIPTVVPPRALLDHARRQQDPREVVVALDMMAAAKLLSPQQVAAYAVGVVDAERRLLAWAVGLASEHARSPAEVRLRLVARLDAGLPALWVNCPVHDRGGRLLGFADLLDVEAGLVIEYDGADHRTAGRHTRDVAKDADLRRVGLEVARVTGTDLRDTATVVTRLREARERSAFDPPERRRWVAHPPADDLHEQLTIREELLRAHEEVLGRTRSTLRRS